MPGGNPTNECTGQSTGEKNQRKIWWLLVRISYNSKTKRQHIPVVSNDVPNQSPTILKPPAQQKRLATEEVGKQRETIFIKLVPGSIVIVVRRHVVDSLCSRLTWRRRYGLFTGTVCPWRGFDRSTRGSHTRGRWRLLCLHFFEPVTRQHCTTTTLCLKKDSCHYRL